MQTNLIQNFVQNLKTPPSERKTPEFNIHHELQTKTFIKPNKSSGYLVKSNIFDAPAIMAKDFVYDLKSVKNGFNGDADDHQLGKINDVGLKIGGLAIAAYLYTKKQSPMTKSMEFIGLGSFLASMSLWPKLAIQLPAYLIHGFNVQQQYVDSFGRKKSFFQDPQFLAWDAYSDKELEKIGDWMGIPKDLPNRNEFTKRKMQKIAVQNNTLWMWTAGFATPIMSALICNQLEKPVTKLLGRINNKKNNQDIKDLDALAKEMHDNKIKNKVSSILSINQNKVITEDLIEELAKAISNGFDPQVKESVSLDLKKLLQTDLYVINENTLNAITANTEKTLLDAGFEKETIGQIIPSYNEMLKNFDNELGFFKIACDNEKLEKAFTAYTKKLYEKIDKYNEVAIKNPESNLKILSKNQIDDIKQMLIGSEITENPVMLGLKKEPYAVLNHNNQKLINLIADAFNSLKLNTAAAEKFVQNQLGCLPETTMANYWNDTIDTFVHGLGLKTKDIDLIKNDRLLATSFLRSSFDDIASDKKNYNKFMTKLIDQIAIQEKLMKPGDTREIMYSNAGNTKLDNFIEKSFKDFNGKITKLPGYKPSFMENTLNYIIGIGGQTFETRNPQGSLKQTYKDLAYNRIAEVKSSFFRIINTLDLYRRLAIGDPKYYPALHNKLPRALKEEVVEISKMTGIAGHTADYLTKFYKQIDPNFDIEDLSDIPIRNGRLIYKYAGRPAPTGKVDTPQDPRLFIESMKLSFENNVHPETEAAFGRNKKLLEEFKKYRNIVLNDVGNREYFENIHRMVTEDKTSTASDNKIFIEVGAATDEVLYNFCKRTSNTNKWLKMFSTAGAALLGVTIFAQFFFGRMQIPKPAATQKDKKYA